MRQHRLGRGLAGVALSGLVLLSGCGGGPTTSTPTPSKSHTLADQPAEQVLAAARTALEKATTVRLVGSVSQGTDQVAIDMRVKGSEGGSGTLTISGDTFEVVRIGVDVYIKTGAAFYAKQPNPQAAAVLADKWIKASTSNPDFADFVNLTDVQKLSETLLAAEGTLSKGPEEPAATGSASDPAVSVRSDAASQRVVLVSVASGRPLRVSTGAADATSSLDLRDYDAPLSLTVPSPIVDPATVPH
jgi:hypothetical protein